MPLVTISAFLSGGFQSDAFLITGSFSTSGGSGILQAESSSEILEDYFKGNDTYLGLWQGTTTPTSAMTLSSLTEELTGTDYQRIMIPKEDWVAEQIERTIYTNRKYSFNSLASDYTISGYFIATTNDNSGVLLEFTKFNTDMVLEVDKYLHIRPSFKIYGEAIDPSFADIVIVEYIADGDYVAGSTSLIPAVGRVTYVISQGEITTSYL